VAVDRVKQEFSVALVDGLKQVYGGRMPSIAVVARDFSLKSPHLPHISGETIRKWIQGESLPHYSRMQVLIEWLGPQVAKPFEKPVKALKTITTSTNSVENNEHEHLAHDELINVIERLSEKECTSILAIARLLAEKHFEATESIHVPHNGHDKLDH